ncbi:DUF3696 domain-containing protein [Bacteroides sp. OttesenSCG-928-D19]|nr:DUF3696 domain-containing protein [Bacteroides sp. OttesenSCG-928-D19]
MNNYYSIKNFRVFDAEGATFELAPITILTGCNSSGKSSVVKSLMLLSDFLKNVYKDYINNEPCHLENYKLDFTQMRHNLGRFDKALNSKAKKGSKIIFKYTDNESFLPSGVNVELSFKSNEKDELNYGWLSDIIVSDSNGKMIYSALVNDNNKLETTGINLTCLKQHFINFAVYYCGFLAIDELSGYVLESTYTPEEKKFLFNEIKSAAKEISQPQIRDLAQICKNHPPYIKNNIKISLDHWPDIKTMYENNTLFYMPIFDWLKDVPKKGTRYYIEEKTNNIKLGEDLQFNLYKIITDFEKSEFNTFFEYFLFWENKNGLQFPNNTNDFGNNSDFITEAIKQTKITSIGVCRRVLLASFDEDGSFQETTQEEKDKQYEEWKNQRIDFSMIYSTLMELCCNVDNNFKKNVYSEYYEIPQYNHKLYNKFQQYFGALLENILMSSSFSPVEHVDSNHVNVQRLYSFDSHSNFNELLKNYFEEKRKFPQKENNKIYKADSFINYWIKEFNIGDAIEINPTDEGLGIMIYLVKNNEKHLLAEEGYGITQLLSLLLKIEVSILKADVYQKDTRSSYNRPPIIGEDTELAYYPQTISIEEPEIHLHPALQSQLAEMFIYVYKHYNIRFIIETHSEYLIRKLQTLVAQEKIQSGDISLNYLYDPDPKKRPANTPQIKKITIKEDGRLNDSFGSGFFDEADNLAMDLLTIKSLN